LAPQPTVAAIVLCAADFSRNSDKEKFPGTAWLEKAIEVSSSRFHQVLQLAFQ
jgi:hypothetical protein